MGKLSRNCMATCIRVLITQPRSLFRFTQHRSPTGPTSRPRLGSRMSVWFDFRGGYPVPLWDLNPLWEPSLVWDFTHFESLSPYGPYPTLVSTFPPCPPWLGLKPNWGSNHWSHIPMLTRLSIPIEMCTITEKHTFWIHDRFHKTLVPRTITNSSIIGDFIHHNTQIITWHVPYNASHSQSWQQFVHDLHISVVRMNTVFSYMYLTCSIT